MDDLADVAKRMRAYAFDHPFDALAALENQSLAVPYTYDFILDGYALRVIFTFVLLSRCDFAQLSIAEQPTVRALPLDLVDKVRDAFFDPADIVTSFNARERNILALMIGKPPIASQNAEQFICRNPRKPSADPNDKKPGEGVTPSPGQS